MDIGDTPDESSSQLLSSIWSRNKILEVCNKSFTDPKGRHVKK